MSLYENDVWLEAAFENFEQAVDERNWPLALDIIADIEDKGFAVQGINLRKRLLAEQMKVR